MINATSRALRLASLLAIAASACASDDDPGSDAGATHAVTGEECFEDLATPEASFLEIQRFESEDGAVRVWRARQPGERSAVGETFAFDLKRAWIETEDEPGTCVTAASSLAYEFGHHNWFEEWTITTEHAVYVGHEMYVNSAPDPADFGWIDSLEATDADGETLFTVDLVDDGCETKPYDLNACRLRMRLDEPPPGWGEE